jgi:hypothetical protein
MRERLERADRVEGPEREIRHVRIWPARRYSG